MQDVEANIAVLITQFNGFRRLVDVIKSSALALIKEEDGQTFKVKVKRG